MLVFFSLRLPKQVTLLVTHGKNLSLQVFNKSLQADVCLVEPVLDHHLPSATRNTLSSFCVPLAQPQGVMRCVKIDKVGSSIHF